MCGLFGVMGSGINLMDLEVVKELGIISQLRGMDSSGVFQINTRNKRDEGYYYKAKGPFTNFLETNAKFKRPLIESCTVDFIMGHTRAATRGEVTDENAHPFDCNNIIGCHNGTMKSAKYITNGKTDSELFLQEISDIGPYETVKTLHKDDAYAVVFYDKNNRDVTFMMNGKRPLGFFRSDQRDVIYWASETSALRYIIGSRWGFTGTYFNMVPGVWTCSEKDIRKGNHKIFTGKTLEEIIPKPVIEVKTVYDSNVTPFVGGRHTPRIQGTVRLSDRKNKKKNSFSIQTACCGRHLDPIEAWEFRNWDGGWFDGKTNEYYCYDESCVKKIEKKDEVNTQSVEASRDVPVNKEETKIDNQLADALTQKALLN